jgi:hypothetical protein
MCGEKNITTTTFSGFVEGGEISHHISFKTHLFKDGFLFGF